MTGKIVGDRYYLEGVEVTRAAFFAAFPRKCAQTEHINSGDARARAWPLLSEGAAVHPDQVREAVESAKRRGVPTEFLPDGRAVFRDRAHRKAYLKAYNFYDRDGGYGDG